MRPTLQPPPQQQTAAGAVSPQPVISPHSLPAHPHRPLSTMHMRVQPPMRHTAAGPPPAPASNLQPPPAVHILYDHSTLSCPSHVPLAAFLAQLHSLAALYGEVASFVLPLPAGAAAAFDASARETCREYQVAFEELPPTELSSEAFLLKRLLRITLDLQQQATSGHTAPRRTSVILLTHHAALTSSLELLRHSPLLDQCILIHDTDAPSELVAVASATLTLYEFLSGAPPKVPSTNEEKHAASPRPHTGIASPLASQRPTRLSTSPSEETASLHILYPPGGHSFSPSNSTRQSPRALASSPQALLPTPSHAPVATSPSLRALGTGHHGGIPIPSPRGKLSSSAPSSPTSQPRSFFPSSQQHSPSHHSQSHRAGSDRHAPYHSANASSARTRACIASYMRIIAYCESEKLIPRESVLKKRLVDSKIQLGEAGGGIEFEEFLQTIVQSGAGIMEGEPPQRIIWPRGPDGQARHFACADFFTPQSRLSPEQNEELLEFLYQVQPEVERGRFGFATYLSQHGPPFVRLLPHGVLVELVQLLLNRKVLLFRKGRVSVASRSEANEAVNLGLLFSATDFQTPTASRAVSPSRSRATSPGRVGKEHLPGVWNEPGYEHAMQSTVHSRRGLSYSTPVTRAPSPTRVASGENWRSRIEPSSSFEKPPLPFEHRKSISSLQPLAGPPLAHLSSDPLVGATLVEASHSTHHSRHSSKEIHYAEKNPWAKEEHARISTSVAPSTFTSRRNSLSDLDSWRSVPFESTSGGSSGLSTDSTDANEPSAVLAVTLARLNSEHIAHSAMASGDELARFTAAVQYRPCFHFEKSGPAHTPEWVCCVAFNIGPQQYQLRSGVHGKKDLAKNEICAKVLQMIDDGSIALAPHVDSSRESTGIDSVVDLARLLNFLQQAPVVYYLTRNQPQVHPSRFDSRPIGHPGMQQLLMRRNSMGSLNTRPSASHGPVWNGSARIQVKSVNILTGEAQPTVSASTPFSHTVNASTTAEAKELIAAHLLQQIQRARVVNPALFTILSAARHNLATTAEAHAQPTSGSVSFWPRVQASGSAAPGPVLHPAPISAPHQIAPVDIAHMPSSASLFSLHTPVAGRPFAGISAIGLVTPMPTPQSATTESTHQYSLPSELGQVDELACSPESAGPATSINAPPLASLTRTTSEALNQEAAITSAASAESALQD